MARKNVLVEIRKRPELESALFVPQLGPTPDVAAAAEAAASAVGESVPGLSLDPSYPPVGISSSVRTSPAPAARARSRGRGARAEAAAPEAEATSEAGLELPELEPEAVLVRGTIDEDQLAPDMFAAGPVGDVAAIFADPVIEPTLTCIDSPPLGTAGDVARFLGVPRLAQAGMDGRNVLLAIVDNGINLEYLRLRGLNPRFSAERSWAPDPLPGQPPLVPGQLPVGHGTMCAFDALIAAPQATLLDIAVLRSRRIGASSMDGLLSDAVLGYAFLLRLLRAMRRPGDFRSLVVSNSWGMFQRTWDLPPGHPGNYSDNPAHPFNRIVGTLERAGADILFAAGNCGRECRDQRCGTEVDAGIYGANSHPAVLSIAGVDVRKQRVGYSTRGPGHLEPRKPDVCGYTHFDGSGVFPADGGTSAATPVVAGLVAAFRSRFPSGPDRTPAALRDLIRRTAENSGSDGFDDDHGFGIVNGARLAASRLPLAVPEGSSDDPGQQSEIPEGGDTMNGDDREFLEALRAFQSPGAGMGGAEFGAAAQGGVGGDQEFMQALAAFGGAGVGGVGAEAGLSTSLQQVCQIYSKVKPILSRILPFIRLIPVIGSAAATAIQALMTALDAVCSGHGAVAQVCSAYGKIKPILSRLVPAIAHIPFIGSAAAKAIQTLMSALDAVCSAVPHAVGAVPGGVGAAAGMGFGAGASLSGAAGDDEFIRALAAFR